MRNAFVQVINLEALLGQMFCRGTTSTSATAINVDKFLYGAQEVVQSMISKNVQIRNKFFTIIIVLISKCSVGHSLFVSV